MTKFNELGDGVHVPFVIGGGYSPEQVENLRRVARCAPYWYVSDCPGDHPIGSVDSNGKLLPSTKRPRGKNGRDRTGWPDSINAHTLDEVLGAVAAGRAGVVGLLVTGMAPGSCVLDFDDVAQDGALLPIGLEIVEKLAGAYIEISPSGSGLRVVCRGTVPTVGGVEIAHKRSVTVDGGGVHSFEVYSQAGKGRYARMTGAAIGTGSVDADGQSGIDWALECIRDAGDNKSGATSTSGKASPGKQNNANAVASTSAGSEAKRTGEEAFAALLAYRPAVEPQALLEAFHNAAARGVGGKLECALRCDLTAFDGDHSSLDYYLVCEVIRQGADSFESVVEVWSQTKTADRAKFKTRAEYRQSTALRAVHGVLGEYEKKQAAGAVRGASAQRVALPPAFVAALKASGDSVALNARGQMIASSGNVYLVMRNHPNCVGMLGYNELRLDNERLASWRGFDREACDEAGPLTADDTTRLGHWMTREFGSSFNVKRSTLREGIAAAARGAKFNPLQDRLLALGDEWDGEKRLSGWLKDFALVDDADCKEYVQAVGRCVVIAMVARAMNPGVKVDTSIVLEGRGGAGKSTLFRVLADAVLPELFTDAVNDITDPDDLVESTKGRWIVELSELAATRRGDVESLKKALTLQSDNYRAPYAELAESIGRRFVFVCTTNRSEYLNDEGDGGTVRRFWPVKTTATESNRMPLTAFAAVAAQVVGEAVCAYLAGEHWWLEESDGEAWKQWHSQRDERREAGAFADELLPVLLKWSLEYGGVHDGKSTKELAGLCGDARGAEGDPASIKRLAATIKGFGLEVHRDRAGVRRWVFPAAALLDFARRRSLLLKAAQELAVS